MLVASELRPHNASGPAAAARAGIGKEHAPPGAKPHIHRGLAFIERLSLPAATSTCFTTTLTSWPTSAAAHGFLMKRSLISERWTNPCAAGPPLGGSTVTKQPNSWIEATTPGSLSPKMRLTKGNTSTRALEPPELRQSFFSDIASFSLPSSVTALTHTWTTCPGATTSFTSATKPSLRQDMCTRPCCSAPMSTTAPNESVSVTVPLYILPTSSWSNGIGGYFISSGLTSEYSGPPSGSSHFTRNVPSALAWSTVPR
mmetsp:Transcript_46119/g.128256  ORF Transcript_46119/g.128256 Transcript_46119/m.128256 type:complete len:257 (+) Transcript_46119:3-773(+)